MDFSPNSSLHDRLLKSRRLHARLRIISNATPASKSHKPEMPEIIKLKSEGIDNVTGSDPAASTDMGSKTDSAGTFGCLLLASQLGSVDRVMSVSVQPVDGGTCTVASTNTGTTAYGLSALGNIALDVDSSRNFASQDLNVNISVDFLVRAD